LTQAEDLGNDNHQAGIAASSELSLRVSVASLVKLLFTNPGSENTMLALERTATVYDIQGNIDVTVRAKPFGGAVRLTDPYELMRRIGDYRYDSDRSQQERDFRILINPRSWEIIKAVCWQNIQPPGQSILDTSPLRELIEEFEDTLRIAVNGKEFEIKLRGMVIEDLPVRTANIRAPGKPTVRVYYVFEAWILDREIIASLLVNDRQYTDQALIDIALQDKNQGRRGRANAVLTLPLSDLAAAYQALPLHLLRQPFYFQGHRLDQNVVALLEEVDQKHYRPYHA
jgi:hypothetical protein